MASRKDLALIRAARANQSSAQLQLGQRYLFGESGILQNTHTALHWLDRAARQEEALAWRLIGEHIPYDTIIETGNPLDYAVWYERAFDAGIAPAAWVLAELVLNNETHPLVTGLHAKAVRALQLAAKTGQPEAQWLLAKHQHNEDIARSIKQDQTPDLEELYRDSEAAVWAGKAADAGVMQAQYVMAEAAWMHSDWDAFLLRAVPIAQDLVVQHAQEIGAMHAPSAAFAETLGMDNMALLSRLVQVLPGQSEQNSEELQPYLELLAYANDKEAQLMLGQLLAKMDVEGVTYTAASGVANYKKAIRWLEGAAEQGMASAWYAMSTIYMKPGFSQRDVDIAQRYLERAAEMGCVHAQYECGAKAWRHRREMPDNDVTAVYWLQKAAAQQQTQAAELLEKIAEHPGVEEWAVEAREHLTHHIVQEYPCLSARIELAAMFGLSRPEALLIDVQAADRGHCMVVDIRADYARSKRRLIMITTGEQRQTLGRLGRVFEGMDAGPEGPEGNYRQRQYRLKTVLSVMSEVA